MEFIILHQTISDGDAIGHDIQEMYKIIEKKGIDVGVFCENFMTSENVQRIDLENLKKKIKNATTVLIYHHSIYWKLGEEVLNHSKCRVIVKYHNITPSYFFENYSEIYKRQTSMGREQTKRLANNPEFNFLSDSEYNNQELISLGVDVEKTRILAPFHKIEILASVIQEQDEVISLLRNNNCINVLFVGRVAPNKGHINICHVANSYRKMYGEKIKFWVIGGYDQEISSYNHEIEELIRKNSLEDNIIFTNKISAETLKSFFVGCDIFLCLSEHEGFGVPLIEAQYFNKPVIALDRAAVKETLGDNQLAIDIFDSNYFAAAIYTVAHNRDIYDYLTNVGLENFQLRFSLSVLKEKFEDYIDEYLSIGVNI
ncbi:glycosyltransferase [Paenibacillus sp. NPDC101420]|uniref:glycosyltransferase n=1 Tax=Paenibacillus sp. NPDC101420 TaxID=3390602 RepID=UPI003D03439E